MGHRVVRTGGPARRVRRVRLFDALRGLATAIAGLGCSIEPEPDEAGTVGDIHRYRVPESGVRILVRADEDDQGPAGEVWSLSVSPAWWREAG
ncbi:hypothetical protein [Streptomyces sp. NPDC012466]|uniref:hypothetical protein n=1 Tax=Streptomyces sp. NPDC012466 TaxID=3364835 RepID=UPI0036E296A1